MKQYYFLCVFLVIYMFPIVAKAEPDAELVVKYTFENVNGKTVPDISGSGYNGTLYNSASVVEMGKYHVLNLGNASGYLDMGIAIGAAVRELGNYSVSAYYRVDEDASLSGNGYFLWIFSSLATNSSSSGQYIYYQLNNQRYAMAKNGWNSEIAVHAGSQAEKGKWQHVVYRQSGRKGQLFVNGELLAENRTIAQPVNTLTIAPSYNWIGRPAFPGDNYLNNTMVYDFCIYNEAIPDHEISEKAALITDLTYQYNYGSKGDFSELASLLDQCTHLIDGAVTGNDTGQYPEAAKWEFEDAVFIARELLEEDQASQFLIDQTKEILQNAYNRFLASVHDASVLPGPGKFDESFNSGFIHPGGLHTQEDFERIKAQLEAAHPDVVAAYTRLKNNEYSGSTVTTYPVEGIVRGGGSGENYMNAARGAAMAYQNALRWKISGDEAHAKKAIQILNSWASICKWVGGDTNMSLAAGLYGYQFANAAELMRDYEDWSNEDFIKFKRWMLDVWYPRSIDFLRRRHDTWRNEGFTGGIRPGHYWSNWGLCNVLCLMSIGVLCDDVFIYNQGLSFYKHDQAGTFTYNRGDVIVNDGLTEFIGNLVPVVHEDERGPYGRLGQMQESGRDQGHALMALGLAVDISQVGWNQGNDLFALMDNRLAAGIEHVAALNFGAVAASSLPWTEYWYHDRATAIHNAWRHTGINEGGKGEHRPYWDRIIGHYEGIKGVKMRYATAAKNTLGADGGGGNYASTSGGFDHLGFSTLTCTRPAIDESLVPTPLTPLILYKGHSYEQAELGGLVNTYLITTDPAVPQGKTIRLSVQLPERAVNTNQWEWSTGDTTQEIEVVTDRSRIYRVTYTNENEVKSSQAFSVAVTGDCVADKLTPVITVKGVSYNDTVITIMPRTEFSLSLNSAMGYGHCRWNNGSTDHSITVKNITADRTYTATYTSQGGRETTVNFHISLSLIEAALSVDGKKDEQTNTAIVNPGQSVELKPVLMEGCEGGNWKWSDGSTSRNLLLENLQQTKYLSVTYSYEGTDYTLEYVIYVSESVWSESPADYYIRNARTGEYLTNDLSMIPVFRDLAVDDLSEAQVWTITKDGTRNKIVSKKDGRFLNEYAQFTTNEYYTLWNSYSFYNAKGTDFYAIRNGGSAGTDYWMIDGSGVVGKGTSSLIDFPFELEWIEGFRMEEKEVRMEPFHRIYPNPVTDYLFIDIQEYSNNIVNFTLYTIEGKKLISYPCVDGENKMDMTHLPAGIYIGILKANGLTIPYKVVKK